MSVSTNTSALRAGAYLVSNSHAAQLSMNRLSSGRKLSTPMDDPGELAVSMKLNSSIIRLRGALNNVQNAISFLEVQDGTLETAGKIIDRMTELKGLSVEIFTKAEENISFLRAQNGGQQSRLAFNLESLGSQMMNMRSAHGRMVDADLGKESTNLAKQLMLSQISASVLAQANASTNSTLMLLN